MVSKCQLCGAVLASNVAACERCGFLDTFTGGELFGEREFSFEFENDPAILALSAAVEVAGSRIRLAHQENSEREVGVSFPSDEDSFPGDEHTQLSGLRPSREKSATVTPAAVTPAALTPVQVPLVLIAAGLALLALLALLACLTSFIGGASAAFAVGLLRPAAPSVAAQPTPVVSATDDIPGLTPRDRP